MLDNNENFASRTMRQARMTAHEWMMYAIKDINELLGEGYAKAHPELIAAYMATAAADQSAMIKLREVEGARADVL